MKLSLSYIFLLFSYIVSGQETYFVTAVNGLKLRDTCSINSKTIGRLPFGTRVKIIERTDSAFSIEDNGEIIDGYWVRVSNFETPYEISQNKDFNYESDAYVFDGYLLKEERAKVKTSLISKVNYLKLKKKAHVKKERTRKVTNFEKVKKMLGNRIKWITEYEDQISIKTLVLDNGQRLNVEWENYFSKVVGCYYPDYNVIRLAGGHIDLTFSLETGEFMATGGDPDRIVHSPSKTLRLNGYYDGHGCSVLFFQQRIKDRYFYVSRVKEYDGCHFIEFYWLSDSNFIFKTENYFYIGEILLPDLSDITDEIKK